MTEQQYERDDSVGEEELQGFIQKLDSWANSLNLGEKALLQLVLERAAGRELQRAEDADLSFPASRGFGEVVSPFLREVVASGALNVRSPSGPELRAVRGWVEAGDPWIQGA